MGREFRKILAPLDGSLLAEFVLPLTVTLAQRMGAKIMLLHIIEENAPRTIHGEPHLTSTQQAESYLAEIARRYAGRADFEWEVHDTEEHNVAQSIAAHITELEADLVVLCTHGRTGLRRVVSGSIAQKVLRRVDAPVLLMRPQAQPRSEIKTLLVPLDGTSSAEAALETAGYLARAFGAMLYLAIVVPTVETVAGDRIASAKLTPISTAAALDVEEEQSVIYLQHKVDQLRVEGIQANAFVHRGDTIAILAEVAQHVSADIIVMATHARAGLDAILTGSVTATLVGRVTQPLLLLRIKA